MAKRAPAARCGYIFHNVHEQVDTLLTKGE